MISNTLVSLDMAPITTCTCRSIAFHGMLTRTLNGSTNTLFSFRTQTASTLHNKIEWHHMTQQITSPSLYGLHHHYITFPISMTSSLHHLPYLDYIIITSPSLSGLHHHYITFPSGLHHHYITFNDIIITSPVSVQE